MTHKVLYYTITVNILPDDVLTAQDFDKWHESKGMNFKYIGKGGKPVSYGNSYEYKTLRGAQNAVNKLIRTYKYDIIHTHRMVEVVLPNGEVGIGGGLAYQPYMTVRYKVLNEAWNKMKVEEFLKTYPKKVLDK